MGASLGGVARKRTFVEEGSEENESSGGLQTDSDFEEYEQTQEEEVKQSDNILEEPEEPEQFDYQGTMRKVL